MIKLKFAASLLAASAVLPVLSSDPVVMTVDGLEIPRSEFEYYYHKNNQQQLVPQSLEDYIEMFKIYRLKVADAIHQGIDTLPQFKREVEQYRKELAAPYITDSLFIENMVKEHFNNLAEDIEISYIRIPKSRNPQEIYKIKLLADSLRNSISDEADFVAIANKYNYDQSLQNGGYRGFMTASRLPYSFEKFLYSANPGEISEVLELNDGFYILKPGNRKPTKGRVEAAHILKLYPMNATQEQKMAAKASIDSIYALITANPDDFALLASINSDDKNSARQGGLLPVFGSGEMISQIDDIVFDMKDGEISAPFESKFGWHILKKNKNIPALSYEEVKDNMLQKISNPQDPRYMDVKKHETDLLIKKYGGRINEETLAEMKKEAAVRGLDSLYLDNWTTVANMGRPLASIGKKQYKVGDAMKQLVNFKGSTGEISPMIVEQVATSFLADDAMEMELAYLYSNIPEYKHLVDEYTDGSLLYELSLQKVWDKAAKDEKGREEFFNKNRSKYVWTKPHVKGYLVQTTNDSISDLVKKRLTEINGDKVALSSVRKEFLGNAMIERIVAEEGQNPYVDFLVFNGPEVKLPNKNFTELFIFEERMIDAPEEASDVKAALTSDYQQELENEWIEQIKAKYPVKVNKKEIMKVK